MKCLIIMANILIVANALYEKEQWIQFKTQHGKHYKTVDEEDHRYNIFQNSLKLIENHNTRYEAGLETYTMGVNQFADMTTEEFKATLLYRHVNVSTAKIPRHTVSSIPAPEAIDWRQRGAVLPVKHQGTCASCWAFSTTGSLEGQNALVFNRRVALSEQELLDCSGPYGNGDCIEGGTMINAFRYIKDHGLKTNETYPYRNEQYTCKASGVPAIRIRDFRQVDQNEEALKHAVGTVGPISVAIYSVPIQYYKSGIFKSSTCYDEVAYLDHGVLVVGYGTHPEPYWIVKNSWGTVWGEDGYIRIARNAHQCGISLDASYPVL